MMKNLIVAACACALALPAFAGDHGPVFGYATPVNSEREVSLDLGYIGRYGPGGTEATQVCQVGYGITPHITLSAVMPVVMGGGSLPETRLAGGGEFASSVAWRFQHSVTAVGRRVESTASAGVVVPGPQRDSGVLAGVARAPGVAATLASGMASRSQYLWLGGGYTRFAEAGGGRRPDTISWSTVYGYRPPGLRRGVDRWDYRGFLELTGEHTGRVRSQGALVPNSDTTSVWLGPSVLAIFRNVAIEGGVQGPLYRDISTTLYGRETVRFAVNVSYLKYSSHTSNH
jgi:hypothetical protein